MLEHDLECLSSLQWRLERQAAEWKGLGPADQPDAKVTATSSWVCELHWPCPQEHHLSPSRNFVLKTFMAIIVHQGGVAFGQSLLEKQVSTSSLLSLQLRKMFSSIPGLGEEEKGQKVNTGR